MSITKNFLFEFIVHINITFHTHLIDVKMYKVFIKNDIDHIVKIFKKTRFDTLFKLDYENIYNKNVFFAEQFLRKSFIDNNIN